MTQPNSPAMYFLQLCDLVDVIYNLMLHLTMTE